LQEAPQLINNYLNYQRVIRGRSEMTLDQYQIDLALFFKFIKASREKIDLKDEEVFNGIDISGIDNDFIVSVTREEIYEFFNYAATERLNISRTRARKLSAIKSFYKYLTTKLKLLEENPAADIESPSIKSSLPKYLSLNESIGLLDAIKNDEHSKTVVRDYAIITVFLNTGIRLSELVGINLSDLDKELRSVRILGKRNKERIIYLNEACREALTAYIQIRANDVQIKDKNALFLSKFHKRISNKTVQWMVKKYLDMADLGNKFYSVHKLRHTAATLMYQTGKVDVRVLKDILGHEQLNTTQIYTHVSDASMENAMSMNPLAKIKKGEDTKDE